MRVWNEGDACNSQAGSKPSRQGEAFSFAASQAKVARYAAALSS